MDAPPVVHPSLELLQGFGLGKLDNAIAERVLAHLETCAECRKTVAGLSGDSFLQHLRAGRPAAHTQSEAHGPGDTAATPGPVPLNIPRPTALRGQDIPVEFRDHPQYEVLFELDRGGMGVVYLARDKFMDRKTVLKVVNKKYFDRPEVQERFLREIRLAAQLSHPAIVTAYAALPLGDLVVFAMEYVEGENLAKFVQRTGTLPVINASYYAYVVAQGLQHAFEKGLVHRDIKPQNLILTRQGKKHLVKILDFGLAKATREQQAPETGLTGSGAMVGTPDYIAPEQTLDASRADIRADIYSLGCTLYFLLAGRPPFEAPSVFQLLQAHQSAQATPLDRVRPDVPGELAAVVAKMMAKEPGQRYQKPAEVAEALKPFVKGTLKAFPPVPAPAPKPGTAKGTGQDKPGKQAGAVPRPTVIEGPATVARQLKRARAKRNATRSRAWLLVPLVGLLLAGVIGLWAGGVFRLKTADGILIVDVNEPNPDVFLDGDRITVTWGPDGKHAEIRLKPGTHKVEVKKDGFAAVGEQVKLEDGKHRVLTAQLLVSNAGVPEPPTVRPDGSTPQLPRPGEPGADGILVLDVNEPNPEVYLDGDRIKVTWGPGDKHAEIHLKPGTHKVEVKKDGFVVVGEQIKLEDGKRRVLTAQLLVSNTGITKPPTVKPDGSTPPLPRSGEPDKVRIDSETRRDWEDYRGAVLTTGFLPFLKERGPRRAQSWKQAAARNDTQGMVLYARCLQEGIGVTKDPVEAVTWYRKAAELGEPLAMSSLGSCYLKGEGVTKDPAEAVKWYHKAIELGNAVAMNNLGWCYNRGEGVAKDPVEAVKWYRKAADLGDALAMNNLGWCCANGAGMTKDPVEAVKWYRKAADLGERLAMRNLGSCSKDPEEAVKWYRKAAGLGEPLAMDDLGWCYQNGTGVTKDPEEAVKWYRKAVDMNCVSSMVTLAERMIDGDQYVTRSPTEALAMLDKAQAGDGSSGDYKHRIRELQARAGLELGRDDLKATRFTAARTRLTTAGSVSEALNNERPGRFYYMQNLIGIWFELGNLERAEGDAKAAAGAYRKAIAVDGPGMTMAAKALAELLEKGAPGLPKDEAKAEELRTASRQVIKRFTVPCKYGRGDLKIPVEIYVYDVFPWRHPLETQFCYFKEERGIELPKEVMDSFERLYKMAKENNVSFTDLCVHAFAEAEKEDKKKEKEK